MVSLTTMSALEGDISNQLGVSGKVGDRRDLNWNTQLSYAAQKIRPQLKALLQA